MIEKSLPTTPNNSSSKPILLLILAISIILNIAFFFRHSIFPKINNNLISENPEYEEIKEDLKRCQAKKNQLETDLRENCQPVIPPTSTPTPTISLIIGEWKTYRNDRAGFSLKYPPNTTDILGSNWKQCFHTECSESIRTGFEPVPGCGMRIDILSNPENLSIVDFYQKRGSSGDWQTTCTQNECVRVSLEHEISSFHTQFFPEKIGDGNGLRAVGEAELGKFEETYIPGNKGIMLLIRACRDSVNEKILSSMTFFENETVFPTPSPYVYLSPTPTSRIFPKTSREEGQMCGGIAGWICDEGLYCKYEGTGPDAAGICQKDSLFWLKKLYRAIFKLKP